MIMTAIAVASFGSSILSGAMSASASRKQARAQRRALQLEKDWNLGVMERNRDDVYASNILESWGSGIDYGSGSTQAVISNNQRVLQNEIDFRREQYDIELKNLKAQSKQKFLGIF